MSGELVFTRQALIMGAGMKIGGKNENILVDHPVPFQKIIPSDQVKAEVDVSWLVANIKFMAICADQNCTLYSNDADDPTETVELVADVTLSATTNDVTAESPLPWPFKQDVTKLFIDTGSQATQLQLLIGVDATPGLSG